MAVNKQEEPTFHGGFVRDRGEGRGVRVSTVKAQDLQAPAGPIPAQEAGKLAKARKTKLATLGIPSAILEAGSPQYARCVRLANAYKKARTKELYEAHGYVSSGATALLAAASLALAASRFLYEIASDTAVAPEHGLGMPQLLKLASSLSDSARQNELSCWELCAREAVIRKRNEAANVALPWMTGEAGQEKKKPGRPRKMLQLSQGETNAGFSVGQTSTSSQGGFGPEASSAEGAERPGGSAEEDGGVS